MNTSVCFWYDYDSSQKPSYMVSDKCRAEMIAIIDKVESRCSVRCADLDKAIADAARAFFSFAKPEFMIGSIFKWESALDSKKGLGGSAKSTKLAFKYRGGRMIELIKVWRGRVNSSHLIPSIAAVASQIELLTRYSVVDQEGVVMPYVMVR